MIHFANIVTYIFYSELTIAFPSIVDKSERDVKYFGQHQCRHQLSFYEAQHFLNSLNPSPICRLSAKMAHAHIW